MSDLPENHPALLDIQYAEVYVDSTGMVWGEVSYEDFSIISTLDTPDNNWWSVNGCMLSNHIEQVIETML